MRQNLKEILKKSGKFSDEELRFLPRSFDIIGSIIVIQIPRELEKKEKIIASILLMIHKNVKTVYSKGKFYGRLRKPKIKLIAGKKIEETIYKESGCLFKLNVKTCFFSPRLSTDRLEIAKQCKPYENVLVMFSGVAPYGIVIAKNSKVKKVICVELNREATKYAKENVLINKLKNIEIVQGDVKKVSRTWKKQKIIFDRIVMPRPQLDYDFLKEALMLAKKGTMINFQDFLSKKEFENKEHIKKIKKATKNKFKILRTRILREVAPYRYNIRVDFKLL